MEVGRTGSEVVVRARGLTVSYGRFTAVQDVTLEARQGEIFGLLGPNGAGKTSVIRALTTIVAPSGGTATIAGHDLSDATGVRTRIGVLPESNGYPGSQTARTYLRYFGELFGMDRREAERQAERRLAQLGLADRRDRIATFSRGMRQRLGLARTLLHEPPVLFLDEPTLGLDPAGQQELLAHLTHAAVEEGACVVLCSHQLDEVERTCDRVAIMHRGRVVAEGAVDELIVASGVAAACTVRVPWADVGTAHALLTASPLVAVVRSENTRPGELTVELVAGPGKDDERRTMLLRLLLDAGIAPYSFDLQGARLSDAFLHLTSDWR